MSYPFIGLPGILPEGEEWDARHIDQLLRDGHDIDLDDWALGQNGPYVVRCDSGKFRLVNDLGEAEYETPDFIELAVFLAFTGLYYT